MVWLGLRVLQEHESQHEVWAAVLGSAEVATVRSGVGWLRERSPRWSTVWRRSVGFHV